MRATAVLQKVLGSTLSSLHLFQQRALLQAVEALIGGRRLTLIDLARSFPGAERVRAPLKRLDRLLSNRRLHGQRETLYGGMARWLLLSAGDAIIVVDWSDLKADGRWCLLRAAVALRGRSVPLLDQVVARDRLGNGRVQRQFLRRLKTLLPAGSRPIVVTDAGFRGDWFKAVHKLGWRWIGRVRGRTLVRVLGQSLWTSCRQLHARVQGSPRHLGVFDIIRSAPCRCCLVLSGRRKRTGRQSLTQAGIPSADRRHLKAAQGQRELCLLACSAELSSWTARQIVAAYRRRMQIEESFRDLKSHQYGHAFEDSQSRKAQRLEVLLLIHALAVLAALLIGHIAEALRLDRLLLPHLGRRRCYSVLRVGWELAARGWISLKNIHALSLMPPTHHDGQLGAYPL